VLKHRSVAAPDYSTSLYLVATRVAGCMLADSRSHKAWVTAASGDQRDQNMASGTLHRVGSTTLRRGGWYSMKTGMRKGEHNTINLPSVEHQDP